MQTGETINEEIEEEWDEFTIHEHEAAQRAGKDPSSRSRICCRRKCLMGPAGTKSPLVTNILHFMIIGFNVAAIPYTLDYSWTWLASINIAFGCLANIFMWCVMCSDPGIQSRN